MQKQEQDKKATEAIREEAKKSKYKTQKFANADELVILYNSSSTPIGDKLYLRALMLFVIGVCNEQQQPVTA